MLRLELAQRGFGVETVHVDNENAGLRTGSDSDVVIGLLLPPCQDDVRIRGGVLEAVGRGRPLVTRPARKDVESPRRESQGCPDHGASPLERDLVVKFSSRRCGCPCLRCADAYAVDSATP